jgi:hypothetical protein
MEEIYKMFWSENLKERYHLENRGSRWKVNIKIVLKEMTLESLDGIHSCQRRSVVDTVMRLLTAVSQFNNIKFTSY